MAGFFTISETCSIEMKIRRSRFIAHLSPVRTAAEVKSFINMIHTEHSTANHNCWAYILGEAGEIEHSSDQGEPPGTAGKPMLNALLKHKLTNTAAVVTRYFGGTKLGIPGLIEAYSTMVESAIESAKIIPLTNLIAFMLDTSYTHHEFIRHQLLEFEAVKIDSIFLDIVQISFEIPKDHVDLTELFLAEMKNIGKIDQWSRIVRDSDNLEIKE